MKIWFKTAHSIPSLSHIRVGIYIHSAVTRTYLHIWSCATSLYLPKTQDFATLVDKLSVDIQTVAAIRKQRYLRPRGHVEKAGNIHLAWVYAGNPEDHGRFTNMLRVSPYVFGVILDLIEDDEVFTNNSNVPMWSRDCLVPVCKREYRVASS